MSGEEHGVGEQGTWALRAMARGDISPGLGGGFEKAPSRLWGLGVVRPNSWPHPPLEWSWQCPGSRVHAPESLGRLCQVTC